MLDSFLDLSFVSTRLVFESASSLRLIVSPLTNISFRRRFEGTIAISHSSNILAFILFVSECHECPMPFEFIVDIHA
jgi:hypothetical protein